MSVHASSADKIRNVAPLIRLANNFAKNAGWMTYRLYLGALLSPRNVPRSESIDFSHDGSFSTSHLGILLSLCTILTCVVNQFIAFVQSMNYWLFIRAG